MTPPTDRLTAVSLIGFLHRATGSVAEAIGLCDHVLAARPPAMPARIWRGSRSACIGAAVRPPSPRAADALAHHPDHAELVLRAAAGAIGRRATPARALALAQSAPDRSGLCAVVSGPARPHRRWRRRGRRLPGGCGLQVQALDNPEDRGRSGGSPFASFARPA